MVEFPNKATLYHYFEVVSVAFGGSIGGCEEEMVDFFKVPLAFMGPFEISRFLSSTRVSEIALRR